jgi:hypothetical protein
LCELIGTAETDWPFLEAEMAFFIGGHISLNNENRRRLMREQALCTPFFKDKDTTNAVLTVIVRYNRGIDVSESIPYAAVKFGVSESEIMKYWQAVKNDGRWLNS